MSNSTMTVVGWKAGPTERGTLNLVWSCVLTIFACTWTVLHLNIPTHNDSKWTRSLRKVKWMIINIVFPEFILSKAICDLRLAVDELQSFEETWQQREKPNQVQKWIWKPAKTPKSIRWLSKITLNDLRPKEFLQTLRSKLHAIRGHSSSSDIEMSVRESVLQDRLPAEEAGQQSSDSGIRQNRDEEHTITLEPKIQEWTLVHSYYVQMGGLEYQHPLQRYGSSPLSAAHLRRRKEKVWLNGGRQGKEHPLANLVLSKEEIQDKSSADWLSKSLAILQVIWVILNVITRHITGLPVTQLEIATVAFAVMAVLIYLANWWKPKDISKPHVLIHDGDEPPAIEDSIEERRRRQSFAEWLRYPERRQAPELIGQRVPNDFVCLKNTQPVLLYLMGVSSLLFGSLHCLAWQSEFPTQVELLCWRTASLISAVLPIVTLAISAVPPYLVAKQRDNQITSKILHECKSVGLYEYPPEWWDQFASFCDIFLSWEMDERIAFLSLPKELRNWREKPTLKFIRERKSNQIEWDQVSVLGDLVTRRLRSVKWFWKTWAFALNGKNEQSVTFPDEVWFWGFMNCEFGPVEGGDIEYDNLLRDIEAMVSNESGFTIPDVNDTCLDRIEQTRLGATNIRERVRKTEMRWLRVSNTITIIGVVFYGIARLIIIVLLFTTLRAMPVGVYQNTSWTRYLPNIS